VAVCYEKCPPPAPFCPLKKGKDQSYEDYLSACTALKAKAAEEFAKRPTEATEAPVAEEEDGDDEESF